MDCGWRWGRGGGIEGAKEDGKKAKSLVAGADEKPEDFGLRIVGMDTVCGAEDGVGPEAGEERFAPVRGMDDRITGEESDEAAAYVNTLESRETLKVSAKVAEQEHSVFFFEVLLEGGSSGVGEVSGNKGVHPFAVACPELRWGQDFAGECGRVSKWRYRHTRGVNRE